jgi:hypothetical protein
MGIHIHKRARAHEKGTIFFFLFLSSFRQCINSTERNERSRAAMAYNALRNEKMGKKIDNGRFKFQYERARGFVLVRTPSRCGLFDHAMDLSPLLRCRVFELHPHNRGMIPIRGLKLEPRVSLSQCTAIWSLRDFSDLRRS